MLERCWKRWPGIRENLRNCNDFICKSCSIVAEADDPFPMCITDGDEFETFNELLSWWHHRAGWRMHWCCYYPYLICLEGFAWTFTCILKVYHFKTVLKSVPEACCCLVVKLGPCQKEICQVLKLVAMQWFNGYVV